MAGQRELVTSLCPMTRYLLDSQEPDIFPCDLLWRELETENQNGNNYEPAEA